MKKLSLYLMGGILSILIGCMPEIIPSDDDPTGGSNPSVFMPIEGGNQSPFNMGGALMGGNQEGGTGIGGSQEGGNQAGGTGVGGNQEGGSLVGGSQEGGNQGGDQGGIITPTDCAPPPRRLRRLSHREYAYTLKDLFNIEISEVGSLVADQKRGGFDQDPHLLTVSPLLAENYQHISESLAELLVTQAHPFTEVRCEENETEGSCIYRWIIQKGDLIYRRPLSSVEADRLFELYETIRQNECQDKAIQWLLIAFLQSPHFLYRTELGDLTNQENAMNPQAFFTLNPYEKASLLSYTLWHSMPDALLFEKAQTGQLTTPQDIAQEITRLMDDEKHIRVLNSFLDQWLGLSQILNVTRDPIVYQALYFEIREMMRNETFLFFKDLWDQEASFEALFTQTSSWLNDELAQYYQTEDTWRQATQSQEVPSLLTPDGQVEIYQLTELPTQRHGGLLTHGSLLTIYAHPTSSSPIHRGLFVRDRLLCEALPPPPEGVDLNVGEPEEGEDTRSHVQAHSTDIACQGCHLYIDPVGFTFESFDGIGRFRTEDQGHPVDSSGYVLQQDQSQVAVAGVRDLSNFLAQNPQAQRCYMRQWVRFVQGEPDEILPFGYEPEQLACQLNQVQAEVEAQNGALKTPLVATLTQNLSSLRSGHPQDDAPTDFETVSQVSPSVQDRLELTQLDLTLGSASDECGSTSPPSDGEGGYRDVSEGIEVDYREDRWGNGMCGYYILRNPTQTPITWTLTHRVDGTLNNNWSSQIDQTDSNGWTTFSGLEWNREIQAGNQIDFGFCSAF